MTSNGLLFNADVIYKTLRTDTVLAMLYDTMKNYKDYYKQRFESEIKNSIVLCLYNNKTVHIDGIAWDKKPTDKFNIKGTLNLFSSCLLNVGKQVTFIDYFKQQYNAQIKDQDQPLLIHKPKRGDNRIEYYVPELCSMTGITDAMKKD
jgi:aubergine-like protein